MSMHKLFKNLNSIVLIGAVLLGLLVFPTAGPMARSLHKGEWIQPSGYPIGFHGWGRLDRVGPDSVIIDDTQYGLAAAAVYNTTEMRDVPLSDLKAGDIIGFLLNAEDEIISLWLINSP